MLRIAAEGTLSTKKDAFIVELKKIRGVKNASVTDHCMVGHNYASDGLHWQGEDPNEDITFEIFGSEYGFIETMGMHIKEGRNFSKNYGLDSSALIVN